MFEKILVPLDGTDLAEGILPCISQLARGLNAKTTLFTVVDPDTIEVSPRRETRVRAERSFVSSPASRGGNFSQRLDRVERAIGEYQRSVAERLDGGGVDGDSKVAVGSPAEEIVRVAGEERYGMIAMSTHARGAVGRGILGSVTDKVVPSSPVPVLTIRPEEAEKYWQEGETIGTLVIPLDGSHLAENVLPYAEELARKLSLKCILAHAVGFGAPPVPAQFYESSTASEEEELEKEVAGYLAETVNTLSAKGLDVTWRVHKGRAANFIVDLARETPQSIVALTTRGNSGVTRWILGSIAEKVVRSSGGPVLIVPGDPALMAEQSTGES